MEAFETKEQAAARLSPEDQALFWSMNDTINQYLEKMKENIAWKQISESIDAKKRALHLEFIKEEIPVEDYFLWHLLMGSSSYPRAHTLDIEGKRIENFIKENYV